MDTLEFVGKFKAIFPEADDVIAEATLQDWIKMAGEGNSPASAPEQQEAVAVLFKEVKATLAEAPAEEVPTPEEAPAETAEEVAPAPVAEGSEAPKE